MGTEGFVAPLLGALQASISVLLTICYGVAAQRVQLMRKESIDDMAGLGVKLFLPALIVVHLGEQLSTGNVLNYVPVLIWSILYTSISIGLAHLISRGFKLPPWVTPTCAFNNTTSLPLLLLQSLESVGSLELLILDGDTVQNAISRAQSYFLVCAVVSKTMGYAVGPKMLEIQNSTEERGRRLDRDPTSRLDQGEAEAQHRPSTTAANEEQDRVNEETTLLVQPVRKTCCTVRDWILQCGRRINSIVPTRMWVPFESPFADVMVLCTVVGVVLGVVPPLHRAFFNDSNDGGIFNAWLTSSIKNIGKLFTTLQIFIVGGKLGLSFEQMRSGSGRIPLRAIITIFVFRLILWPAISISLIYILARSTGILQNDPILWFSMMLMPAGPPALVISSLAELAKIPESEEIEIAKSLTIMYALSPFVCFAITGALKASEAALKARGL